MSYADWSIDKRLVEAGGIGKTVYILPARGGCRFPREALERYIKEGMDVEFVTLKKHNPPSLSNKDIQTIRDSIQQFELYSKLANPWKEPWFYEMFKDFYPEERKTNDIWIRATTGDYILNYTEMINNQYLGVLEDNYG